MHTLTKLATVAILFAATAAQAQVNFNANAEIDPTFTGKQGATKSKTELLGRIELNAGATVARQGDNFVNARASLILPVNGSSPSIDDLWIQLGNAAADLKLGRMEAADLFPLGMDTVVTKADSTLGYMANSLRGRVSNKLHAIVGSNLAPNLRAELGVVTKNSNASDTTDDAYGVRPTLVYTSGPLTLRGGFEALQNTSTTVKNSTGIGLSAGYALDSATRINVNYATNDKRDASSVGLNVIHGGLGLGYIQDKTASAKGGTTYLAYKMPLLGMKNAFWTPAISHSTADGKEGVTAVRVRLNFGF